MGLGSAIHVGGLATAILKMPGVIAFMLVFLLLRMLFLFLEFTLAAFRRRTPATLPLIGAFEGSPCRRP